MPLLIRKEDGSEESICAPQDEKRLRVMLTDHFNGVTTEIAPVYGVGLREKKRETNKHRRMTVLASRSTATTLYFRALHQELETSSGEEQILILREELAVV